MGRPNSKGKKAAAVASTASFYLFLQRVYKRNKKYVRVKLTKDEAETLLDALESWIEGSREEAWSADDDIIYSMFGSMNDATAIRRKLWHSLR